VRPLQLQMERAGFVRIEGETIRNFLEQDCPDAALGGRFVVVRGLNSQG